MPSAIANLPLWAAVASFFGSVLLSWGFQLKTFPGYTLGDLTGEYQMVALKAERLWALNLGWALVILGFLAQIIAALRARLTPK